MARIIYSGRALADLQRLFEFLAEHDSEAAIISAQRISQGVEILANHPLIGRPAAAGLRELILSKGRTGYVALYRFDVSHDVVRILSIRHQREWPAK